MLTAKPSYKFDAIKIFKKIIPIYSDTNYNVSISNSSATSGRGLFLPDHQTFLSPSDLLMQLSLEHNMHPPAKRCKKQKNYKIAFKNTSVGKIEKAHQTKFWDVPTRVLEFATISSIETINNEQENIFAHSRMCLF